MGGLWPGGGSGQGAGAQGQSPPVIKSSARCTQPSQPQVRACPHAWATAISLAHGPCSGVSLPHHGRGICLPQPCCGLYCPDAHDVLPGPATLSPCPGRFASVYLSVLGTTGEASDCPLASPRPEADTCSPSYLLLP